MPVREYKPEDLTAIEAMFLAQGFEYSLPDLENGNMQVKMLSVDGWGRIQAAILGRRTIEAYFLMARGKESPSDRYNAFLELHNAACEKGAELGYDDVQCLLPATIEKRFGRRLQSLGWGRNEWTCYSRSL